MKPNHQITLPLLTSFIIALFMTSCVSQKKYNELSSKYDEAIDEIARLSVDSTILEYEKSSIAFNKDKVIENQEDLLDLKADQLEMIRDMIWEEKRELAMVKITLNALTNTSWSVEERSGRITLTLDNNLLFPVGSAKLSASGKQKIKEITETVKKLDDVAGIWVMGHTDYRTYNTANKDNWDLSTERSLAVIREMIDQKIDPTLLTAAARSKFDPETHANNEEALKQNRRTEIVIIPENSIEQEILETMGYNPPIGENSSNKN